MHAHGWEAERATGVVAETTCPFSANSAKRRSGFCVDQKRISLVVHTFPSKHTHTHKHTQAHTDPSTHPHTPPSCRVRTLFLQMTPILCSFFRCPSFTPTPANTLIAHTHHLVTRSPPPPSHPIPHSSPSFPATVTGTTKYLFFFAPIRSVFHPLHPGQKTLSYAVSLHPPPPPPNPVPCQPAPPFPLPPPQTHPPPPCAKPSARRPISKLPPSPPHS